jgi:hypothetical protein
MLKNNNNLLTVNHVVLILPLTLNHSLLFFKRFYPGRVPSSGKGPNLKLLTPTNKSTLPVVPKRSTSSVENSFSTSSLKKPSSRISQKRHSSIPPLRKPIDEQYEASHPQPPTTHSSAPAPLPPAPPAPSAPPGPPAPSGPPAHFPFVPAPRYGLSQGVFAAITSQKPSPSNFSDVPITTTPDDDIRVFIVPPAPLLPPGPLVKPAHFSSHPIAFTEELKLKCQERQQRSPGIVDSINKVDALQEQKNKVLLERLLIFEKYYLMVNDENNGEKLTKKFFDFLTNKCLPSTQIHFSVEDFQNNPHLSFGLLEVIKVDDTILLDSLHKHVILLYTTKDNHTIIWGYLTSDKGNSFLSNYQPFNASNKKEQYVHISNIPFLVNASDIKALPDFAKTLAEAYLQDDTIKSKLTTLFLEKVIPKFENPISIYDGKGITENDLDQVLDNFSKKEKKISLKWYNEYKLKDSDKKLQFLNKLKDSKNSNPLAYEYLHTLINNEKN